MGLLDADTEEGQRFLGLLAAAGPQTDPAKTGFGTRLLMANDSLNAWKQQKLKEEFTRAQMDNYKSEIAQRDAALQNQKRWQEILSARLGGGGDSENGITAAPKDNGMGGSGLSIGGVTASGGNGGYSPIPTNRSGSGIAGMSLEDISLIKGIGGPDLLPAWKIAKEGIERKAGTYYDNPVTGQREYIGDPTKGLTLDGSGAITRMRGSENIASLAGEQTDAQERAKNRNTLMPADRIDAATGRPFQMTVDEYIHGGQKQDTSKPFGNFSGNPSDVLGQIATIKDPVQRADAIAAFQSQLQAGGGKLLPNRQSGAMAGPTELAASKELATQGAQLSAQQLFESHKQAQSAADSLISLNESRNAIAGGVYAGAGADVKLNLAKGLQALGIPVDPNKVTNTDYLKSQVGQNVLAKAKTLGANPTDADARRIEDIVGTIGKDPQALNKLLDYQEQMLRRSIDQHNTRYTQAQERGFAPYYDMSVKAPEFKQEQQQPKTFGMLPPANQFAGKRMKSDDGSVYRSNGKTWVKE